MDNRLHGSKPNPVRHHSPASSLDNLRAFTNLPSRPAQEPAAMMQSMHNRTGSHPVADVKPRLTKEQHDLLEDHFQHQQKPTTNTKKGYADSLGVPLDKINNWFQNRRAKVKQDAKKLQNQQMMYNSQLQNYTMQQQQQQPQQLHQQHQPQAQHQHHMSAPNASSFFASNSSVSPATRPVDNVQLDGLSAQFNLQPNFGSSNMTAMADQTQPSSYNAVIQSMIAAGYPVDMTQQQDQFDFENGTNSSFDSTISSNGQFLSSLTIPTSGFGDSLDFSTFTPGSTALPTSDSPGSFAGTHFTPGTQSSLGVHPAGSMTSLPYYDDDSDGNEAFDPNYGFQQSIPHRHAASSSQISLPIFNGPRFAATEMYQQNNHSSQVLISTPDQYDPLGAFGDLEPPNAPFMHEAFSRRSSSTSNLADGIQNVGIDSRTPSESGSFKQLLQGSSIAARRQRRPAPLGSSATRSASYTPGMPGSPSNASQTSLNAEQKLRRIRSSQGMNGGRIQKNSTGSAQHSPITFAFNAAASSPKFARELASAVSTPGAAGSFAPPTPQTPNEGARFPSWQTSGEIKPQPSFADTSSPPDSLGINFSAESSSEPQQQPDTKGASSGVNAGDIQQYQATVTSSSSTRDTPPQSAPPTQQNFSQSMLMPQTQTSNDFLAPDEFTLSHMRRPSLPESASSNPQLGNQMQQFGMANFNASGGLQSMGYPMQYGNVNGYNMSMYPGGNAASASSAPPQAPNMAGSSDFLVIHEYAPPNSSGKSNDPKRAQKQQPQQYSFAHTGPNDFTGTS